MVRVKVSVPITSSWTGSSGLHRVNSLGGAALGLRGITVQSVNLAGGSGPGDAQTERSRDIEHREAGPCLVCSDVVGVGLQLRRLGRAIEFTQVVHPAVASA